MGSCILTKKLKSWSRRCRAIRLLSIFLAILKASKHPSCFALLEISSLSRLTVNTHLPVTTFFGLNFRISTKSKTSLSNHGTPDLGGLRLDEQTGIDLELFQRCLFSCSILPGRIQCSLIHVGQKHKADRSNEVGKAVAQPMRNIKSLRIIPELGEES